MTQITQMKPKEEEVEELSPFHLVHLRNLRISFFGLSPGSSSRNYLCGLFSLSGVSH